MVEIPIACDKDVITSAGVLNGPKVMTGQADKAENFIVDSCRKSICHSKNTVKYIDQLTYKCEQQQKTLQ